jgi:hypothetical protein
MFPVQVSRKYEAKTDTCTRLVRGGNTYQKPALDWLLSSFQPRWAAFRQAAPRD